MFCVQESSTYTEPGIMRSSLPLYSVGNTVGPTPRRVHYNNATYLLSVSYTRVPLAVRPGLPAERTDGQTDARTHARVSDVITTFSTGRSVYDTRL